MGEAVAYVEVKFIIVVSGEVGDIITLYMPICESISCTYYSRYFNDNPGTVQTAFYANSTDKGYEAFR